MDGFARADRIRARVDEWSQTAMLGAELYDVELAYFRRRYFAQGEFTYHFQCLNLRPVDQPELVEAVISGANNEPRDRVLAVLLIIWRFRNNLFHGAKWSYRLRDQRANFTHSCHVLMRILERHGDLHE